VAAARGLTAHPSRCPFVGHAAICGVFLIGIGYVAYSLIDRIDARDLGFADRVDGVVMLVANRVQPEPGA